MVTIQVYKVWTPQCTGCAFQIREAYHILTITRGALYTLFISYNLSPDTSFFSHTSRPTVQQYPCKKANTLVVAFVRYAKARGLVRLVGSRGFAPSSSSSYQVKPCASLWVLLVPAVQHHQLIVVSPSATCPIYSMCVSDASLCICCPVLIPS